MNFSKLLLIIQCVIIFLFGGIFFTEYNQVITNSDLIITFFLTILFTITNYYISKRNVLICFLNFYTWNLCILIPFLYVIFFPDKLEYIIPKYMYLQYGFLFIFAKLYIFLAGISFLYLFTFKKPLITNSITESKALIINIFSIVVLLLNFLFIRTQFIGYPYFYLIFNPQVILILLIHIFICSSKSNKIRVSFCIYIILYVLSVTLEGSRSGIFNVFFIFLLLELYKNGDFFMKFRSIVLSIFVLLFSVASYSYATATRISRSVNYDFNSDEIGKYLTIDSTSFEFILGQIVKRFSLIDYSYAISNSFYSKDFFNQNVNFLELFKSTINITFPANIFEKTLTSNTYLRSLNEDLSKGDLLYDWSSYNSTFYDFNFLYFNYFSILISFSIFWFFLKSLSRIHNNFSSYFFSFTLIQISYFYVFFGYDYLIKNLLHGYLTVSFLTLLFSLNSLHKRPNYLKI
jgi:hypothetical protein